MRPLSALTARIVCSVVLAGGLVRGLQPTFWNPFRFLQQSSRFVQLPGNGLTRSSASASTVKIKPGDVLFKADGNSPNQFEFAPLDDVVMGGVSGSSIDRNAVWKGTVTDANNGGFIGIRSVPNGKKYDVSACKGLQATVRLRQSPNNQRLRFKLATRDSTEFNGLTWASSVDAIPGKVTVWRVPFRQQKATQFARVVPNQRFATDNLVGVQFVYSKFEYDGDLNPFFALGNVELQIDEIEAY